MKSYLFRLSLTMPLALSMLGCVANHQPSTPGARNGYVNEFYTEQSLASKVPSCLAGLSREQILSGKYVEVQVSHFRGWRWVSAEIPVGMKLNKGDKVVVSPTSCKDGQIPKVIQVLSAKSPSSVTQP
jgi:hypothetical protein